MTNQTVVFSVLGLHGNIASVTDEVNLFIKNGLEEGTMSNFHIQPVVVNPSADPARFWYTVQVNFYSPSVQEA